MGKMKVKLKAYERKSIRKLLASLKKTMPRKKSRIETGVESENISIARLFGIDIRPTEKQYENIAAPFVKQR